MGSMRKKYPVALKAKVVLEAIKENRPNGR